MKIIVGLGNPGKEYENTRHNVGFMVVDELPKNIDAMVIKPQTFMNKSGEVVLKELKKKGIKELRNLWVVHDDLDLEVGRIKIDQGGSSGHHGIESIIKAIGTDDFIRFRVGVGRPKSGDDKDYLLSGFTREDLPIIKKAIKRTAEAIVFAIDEGLDKAMNEFNKH